MVGWVENNTVVTSQIWARFPAHCMTPICRSLKFRIKRDSVNNNIGTFICFLCVQTWKC